MFGQKISSIENQIQELNAKLDQYRSLGNEVEVALEAISEAYCQRQIARIKQSALALGVQDEVSQQFVEAVGVSQWVSLVEDPEYECSAAALPISSDEVEPTAAAALPISSDDVKPQATATAPSQPPINGQALIGEKVITPEGLTGFAKSLEPVHKDMIIVEFTNGSSPYYKGDLKPAVNQSTELSPRPDRFYYQPVPEIKVGDWVQIYSGDICEVLQAKDIGGRLYVEVQTPSGRKEAFRDTDLKALTKEEVEARQSILTTTKAPKKPKAEVKQDPEIEAQRLGQELLGKDWEDIRVAVKECPKSLREAGLAARTKTQKKWVEELPRSIADFIRFSDDDSDLIWLPNHIKQRVQTLLQEAQAAA